MRILPIIYLTVISFAASAQTVLITGSNSGIGYEYARQYAADGWDVIATHRRDSVPDSLARLSAEYDNVRIETLDVTMQGTVDALAAKLKGQPIDVLVNNAGIVGTFEQPEQIFGTLDYDLFERFMATNAAGPLRVSEAFYDNVRLSEQKKIIAVSTGFASITSVQRGAIEKYGMRHRYWYNMSKAALNMGFSILTRDARADGVSILLMQPGLVRVERTEAYDVLETTEEFRLDVDVSVARQREQIENLTVETSGSFISVVRGNILPW